MTDSQKSARGGTATRRRATGFSDEERAAMKDRVREQRRGSSAAQGDDESAVLEKIAELPTKDRLIAERLHALIKTSAPALSPKTWYGMPAYARDGKVFCHFQSAQKFKTRYATLGFSDAANLDEGGIWPVAFALKEMTATEEAKVRELLKKALA